MQTSLTLATETETPVVAAKPTRKPAAKAATKPAVKKPVAKVEKTATDAKPAAKPGKATKGAPKAASGIKFCLIDRPASGGNLYAFTQAVLNQTGLAKGKGVAKSLLTSIMGATAVRYHLNKTTFGQDDKGNIVLTPAGKFSFSERVVKGQVDAATVEAYEVLFATGQTNANLAMAKNKLNIRAVA